DDARGGLIFSALSHESADAGVSARRRARGYRLIGSGSLEHCPRRHSHSYWSANGWRDRSDSLALPSKCVLGLDGGGSVSIFAGARIMVNPREGMKREILNRSQIRPRLRVP